MKAVINNPIFRWIAVVPGAFLAVVAAMFPWHWLVMIYANIVPWISGGEGASLSGLVRLIGPVFIALITSLFLGHWVLLLELVFLIVISGVSLVASAMLSSNS